MDNIDTLNNKLLSAVGEKYPIGLEYGKMGICLYFYYLSRLEDKEGYKQTADKLLDEVTNKLSKNENIGDAYILAGIAVGISHLVRENFVGGNINEILEDVDNQIFKILAFKKNEDANYPKPMLIPLLIHLWE
jgi:lantibiotic modifying enzyme